MSNQPVLLNAFAAADAAGSLGDAGLPDAPFVGLRPFQSSESVLFFGRREQTAELLQLLHRERFLAVVGSSGCGKSSLIRAGLIPKLKAGFIVGRSDRWLFLKMRPGNSPLANLATELLSAFDEEPTTERVGKLVEEIRLRGPRAVTARLAGFMRDETANVFLLVDQFEEIFRFGAYDYCEDEGEVAEATRERDRRRDEAAEFVAVMLALAAQDALPVYVVLTMRSDFLGDCDAFYGLPQAMNRSQYLVPRLTRQQRREAVESPVRLYGATIAPRLLDRVLNDMGEEPDQLPVTQHALLRTWEKWAERREGPIDLAHYEHAEVGGVKHALSLDADSAMKGMSDAETRITERMFQALTKTDARGRRLRRPATLSEIEAVTGADRETVLGVIERFSGHNRSFLHVSGEKLGGDALVDISHESLIRQWGALGDWVKEEVNSREQYLRLAADAVLHFDPTGPKVALWRDPALQLALDWWDERRPNEAWARRYHPEFALAHKFLVESRDARESQKKAAAHAQRRKLRWLITATAVLATLLLLTAATAVYAVNQQRHAQAQKQRAEESERELKIVYLKVSENAERLQIEKEKAQQAGKELLIQRNAAEESRLKAEAAKNEAVEAQRKAVEALKAAEDATLKAQMSAQEAELQRNETKLTLDIANQRKAVDDIHRAAIKAVEAVHINEAHVMFARAIDQYKSLDEFDAMAYTHKETGNLLLFSHAEKEKERAKERAKEEAASKRSGTRPEQRQPVAYSKEDLKVAECPAPCEVRSNELAGVLGYAKLPDAFRRVYNIEDEERDGLTQYGEAIRIYRNPGDVLRNEEVVFRDWNGSAALFNKVGDLLDAQHTDAGRAAEKARSQMVIDAYCEAYTDYKKAENLEGQVSLLVKLGEYVEGHRTEQEREAGGDGGGLDPDASSYKGCAGRGGPAAYYKAAVNAYGELLKQANDPPLLAVRRKELADTYIKLGVLYLREEKEKTARENFDAAVAVFSEAKDNEGTVTTLLEVTKQMEGEMVGDDELIAEYKRRAVEECRKGCPEVRRADLLYQVARDFSLYARVAGSEPEYVAKVRSLRETALEYVQEASQIYERLGKRDLQSSTLVTAGNILHDLNMLDKARASLEKALKLREELGDTRGQGSALYYLGRIQERQGQREQAKASYTKSLETLTAMGDGIFKRMVAAALQTLEAADAPATGTQAAATRTELKASLKSVAGGAYAPKGEARFESDTDGDSEFQLKVKNVRYDQDVELNVLVDDRMVSTVVVHYESQRARLILDSGEDDVVPKVKAGSSIKITDGKGETVFTGKFVSAAAPATNK